MTGDEQGLLRVDRVGLYNLMDAWAKLPWLTATYGDLWLSNGSQIGFQPVRGAGWNVSLGDVRNLNAVSFTTALRCSAVNIRRQLLEATFGAGEQRFVVQFTGITKFMGTADRLASHIPHVGHLAEDIKMLAQNWSMDAKGRAAREFWWQLLTRA
jgi:hypothetical protein